MPVVVSDTSPLRALQALDLLGVLEPPFGGVLIPPAVRDEPAAGAPALPVIQTVVAAIQVVAPANTELVAELRERLDLGEAEAIALAIQVNADAVLIDEATGRRVASELGLAPLGALGVLIRAKRAGLIAVVGPLIDRLESKLKFRVSREVRARILELAGEDEGPRTDV